VTRFEDECAIDGGCGGPILEVPYSELDGVVFVGVLGGEFYELAIEVAYPCEDYGDGSEEDGDE